MAPLRPIGSRRFYADHAGHPVIRAFRRGLLTGTTPEGWLAIEGPILFTEALRAGGYVESAGESHGSERPKIQGVLATEREAEKFDEAFLRLPDECELTIVPEWLFQRIAQTEAPRGI